LIGWNAAALKTGKELYRFRMLHRRMRNCPLDCSRNLSPIADESFDKNSRSLACRHINRFNGGYA